MDFGDDDYGGLDDLFVPRHRETGDPLPNTEPWWAQGWGDDALPPTEQRAKRKRRFCRRVRS